MFSDNFYPTPESVIQQMTQELELKGKTILEPSAGKGNIIEYCQSFGAKVIACELHPDLAKIAAIKADKFLKNDFFKVESTEISHIDYIIMNPPFENADKHILHAWEIAPAGCIIVALANSSTIKNAYTQTRKQLATVIENNGLTIDLGPAFLISERKNGASISIIELTKPGQKDTEFADYLFSDEDDEQNTEEGIVKYSYIRDIVGRYIQSVQMYDRFICEMAILNNVMKPIGGSFSIEFSAINERSRCSITRDTFKTDLQKSAWRAVFNELKMNKYLTKSALDEVNKYVEQNTNRPFTVRNIQTMVKIIVGTHSLRMQKVIVEVFDWLTDRYHDNRINVEGWKTNSQYMVNRKFIAPYSYIRHNYSGYPEADWRSDGNRMDDLTKALCQITGTNYETCVPLYDFFRGVEMLVDKNNPYGGKKYEYKQWGTWYEWNFFKIKVFKKGTLHAEFLEQKVWEKFNLAAAKAKGWHLPEKTTSDFRQKSNGVEVYN